MSSRTLLAFLIAFVVSVALTPMMRRIALAAGIVDRPAERKVHTRDVPYMGGVAISGGAGTASGVVLGCLFIGIIRSSLPLVGISAFWQMFINGVVILVAVLLGARQRRRPRTILEARA